MDRLPHPLHAWDPVVGSGNGAPLSLPLSWSAATGRGGWAGDAAAWPLSLTQGAGGGHKATGGAGAGRALPLSLGEATGTRPSKEALGDGDPFPLALMQASGQGIKRASGYAGTRACPITFSPASGYPHKPGRALAFSLPLTRAAATGGKDAVGDGRDYPLQLLLPRPAGIHREFFFTAPTDHIYAALKPNTRLVSRLPVGLSVWRVAGEWHTGFSPNPDRLIGADRMYRGGYAHPLTDDLRAELEAGGFGPHLTLMEVR